VNWLGNLASRLAGEELLRLAAVFNRRAEHFDRRSHLIRALSDDQLIYLISLLLQQSENAAVSDQVARAYHLEKLSIGGPGTRRLPIFPSSRCRPTKYFFGVAI
jgi:hypothetical protein